MRDPMGYHATTWGNFIRGQVLQELHDPGDPGSRDPVGFIFIGVSHQPVPGGPIQKIVRWTLKCLNLNTAELFKQRSF